MAIANLTSRTFLIIDSATNYRGLAYLIRVIKLLTKRELTKPAIKPSNLSFLE